MSGHDARGNARPGWYEDPGVRHQWRFWDGARWTDDVADDGQASTDPLEPKASVRPVDRVVDEGSESTALHLACSHGELEQVRSLLAQGARVDVVNKWGATPLDLTYSNGADSQDRAVYAQIAQLLRARGATALKWSGPTC